MRFNALAAAAVAALALAGAAQAEEAPDYAAEIAALGGDATEGAKVYRKCQACHNFDPSKRKVGPHQVGIIGRPVAIVEGYRYSKAMEAAAKDNPNTEAEGDAMIWDVETLTEYLRAPRSYVKGTKMAFVGLKKDEDIANVLAYLLEEGGVYEAPES